jgi:hypothetical protein
MLQEPGQLTSRLTSDCYAITRCIATNVSAASVELHLESNSSTESQQLPCVKLVAVLFTPC